MNRRINDFWNEFPIQFEWTAEHHHVDASQSAALTYTQLQEYFVI